jgi:hypothetical protein
MAVGVMAQRVVMVDEDGDVWCDVWGREVRDERERLWKKWPRLKFVSVFMMGGALLVKLTWGTKMQESPENNLRTEDSICLFVFNLLLWDCAYVTLRWIYLKMAPNADRY